MGMKRASLVLVFLILLSGCGQSNEERAKELIKQSCEAEFNESITAQETVSLIRQAVELDEKYRSYLVAWIKWQDLEEEMMTKKSSMSPEEFEVKYRDFKDNYAIVDSYCMSRGNF